MYEQFFDMKHTPFTRNVPADQLFESQAMRETLGRLCYAADRQLFAVVTAEPGCGGCRYEDQPDCWYFHRLTDLLL